MWRRHSPFLVIAPRSRSIRRRRAGRKSQRFTMNDDQAALAGFRGEVRLFPLPNLVLFPHVVQGLHVFEPRYRQLLTDSVAGDHLIGLVLLQPGWEEEYDATPDIESVACLCRIG